MLQLSGMYFKRIINKLDKLLTLRIIFIATLFLFTMLLLRNPFGERTLIPNLEPFPDTINYLTPARSVATGGPFKINREERSIGANVPPLYSVSLIPFYLINKDVRMYYFANVLMSIISLYLLYQILGKVINDKWIIGISLFFFATNFFMYWYPQWAMAENIVLPIFLLGILQLVSRISTKNIIIASLIPGLLYSAKYAYVPVSIAFGCLYLLRIFRENIKSKKYITRDLVLYIVLGVFCVGLVILYAYLINGLNPFPGLFKLLQSFIPSKVVEGNSGISHTVSNSWMSFQYMKTYFPRYLLSLVGNEDRFLWDFTPIVPKWIGIISLVGLITGYLRKKTCLISIYLTILLLAEILFMSLFYAFDMRYVYHAIPTLVIGFSLFLLLIKDFFLKRKRYYLFFLLLVGILGLYVFQNTIRLKSQIMINLKYAETPWYYISVLKLNNYFKQDLATKPIVISPMVPYYIDYYSNGNYELLPLSTEQEFRNSKKETWGEYDYSNLSNVYANLLRNGRDLYVSTYGLGNEAHLHATFDNLKTKFNLTTLYEDCYNQCNLYKLELK